MKRKTVEELFQGITGGATPQRLRGIEYLAWVLNRKQFSKLRIVECQDEKTGERYGRAKCRAGRCMKIGGGGRNKGSRYAYQVWADWS